MWTTTKGTGWAQLQDDEQVGELLCKNQSVPVRKRGSESSFAAGEFKKNDHQFVNKLPVVIAYDSFVIHLICCTLLQLTLDLREGTNGKYPRIQIDT